MNDTPTSSEAADARAGLLRLHDAVRRREPGSAESALSPEALLSLFREADPTLNGSCMTWLLRTYASGGYRLEDLNKARETLETFARLRQRLPNIAVVDDETRNPRKLGSHTTLASLWTAVAPLVEAERQATITETSARVDGDKERALAESRVLLRNERMIIVVPTTEEASCWWGQGTRWCTAARKSNAFETYNRTAPLIVICLRKNDRLPAQKLQLHVHSRNVQFMNENDSQVSANLIEKRWDDLEPLLHWAISVNGEALSFLPESFRTKELCTIAVTQNGTALMHVPDYLRTAELCTTAITQSGRALEFVPEHLRTEQLCAVALMQDGNALGYIPKYLCTDELYIRAMSQHGWMLKFIPEYLRTEEICMAAVGSYGYSLQHVPERLHTDIICSTAIAQNGLAMLFVPERLYTESLFTTAVTQNGYALMIIPEHLHTDALRIAAVTQDPQILRFISKQFITEELCTIARAGNLNKSEKQNLDITVEKSHDLVLAELEFIMAKIQSEPRFTQPVIGPR